MKLVDILARELKDWPVGLVWAVQDYDGEVKFDDSPDYPKLTKDGLVWLRHGLGGESMNYFLDIAEDRAKAIVNRAQWLSAVDTLAAQDMHDLALGRHDDDAYLLNGIGSSGEQVSYQFKGEVLPSVGTKVKIYDDGSLVYGHGESGEVIAHVENCAVVRMSYGLGCFMAKALITAEQVEAEEKVSVTTQMLVDGGFKIDQSECVRRLYEAGWRLSNEPGTP